MTDQDLRDIFENTKTIAVVGLSSNPARPSFGVTQYLQEQGFRIIPVNPNETEVHGEKAYAMLADVPEPFDLVEIFRNPEAVPAVVDEALKTDAKVIWMQDGAGNEEAAAKARAADRIVVVDDCMLRQHRRLYG
jgi:hypothetical protein